jgi:hypothetical protein
MDAFSYLSVLISIILGLGVTHLLSGVGRIIERRDRVAPYWPAFVWAAVLFILHVQTWWVMFGLRAYQGWTFGAFLVVLVQPAVLYLLAVLVFPPGVGDDAPVDMRANYFRQAPWFFGLAMLLLVQSIARDLVINGALPNALNLAAHAVFFALWTGAALTRREAYHHLVAVCTAVLFATYVGLLFTRLR